MRYPPSSAVSCAQLRGASIPRATVRETGPPALAVLHSQTRGIVWRQHQSETRTISDKNDGASQMSDTA